MALPTLIPGPDVPMCGEDGLAKVAWYLFLYNIANQVLPNGAELPISPFDQIDMVDLDATAADGLQSHREVVNAALLQPDADVSPTLRDMANALALGTFDLLPDPVPLAQPAAAVTVGASPFTYSAPFTGTVSVTGGTVSLISIIRQGVTVATGITTGLVPVSKFDQVKVTYSVLPTVVFLPT